MKKDNLGDRMKLYESVKTSDILIPRLPIYCRLDGRCFSKFTKGFKKPYDPDMSNIMMSVTEYMVNEFSADLGYCQSDEISLVWKNDSLYGEFIFGGKTHKLLSILPSKCTSKFINLSIKIWPIKCEILNPSFDCRIFNLPSLSECSNIILWRELDATRNSINSAARTVYSHKELHNKTCSQMQELLFKKGINWNEYPEFFKKGTYYKKTPIILNNEQNGHEVKELNIPPLIRIKNSVDVLFNGTNINIIEPIMKQ